MLQRISLAIMSLALFAFANCGSNKDYLVVVDTSGSMQEKNTFKRVKDSMPKLLDALKKGDTVTVMRFDTEVQAGSTIKITGDADRAAITKEIESMKAQGSYTDMAKMLLAVREKVKAMKDEGKTAHIVVLSDGLDDPRPEGGKKRGSVDIGKYRDQEGGPVQDAFIYYISLGDISNPALEEQLKKLSPQTKTYLAGNRAGDAGKPGSVGKDGKPVQATPEQAMAEVGSDVSKNDWLSYVKKYWIYAAGLVLLGLLIYLAILLFRKLAEGESLYGTILYYPEGIQFPNKNTFTLDKVGKAAVTIGARQGNRLRIKDLGTNEVFSFKGKKVGPNLCLKPLGKSARNIQFLSQRQQGLVSPGDRFRLGDYSFIFNDEEA